MNTLYFYHNAKCTKSRQAKELLDSHNIEYELVDYMKKGLRYDEVENILILLHLQPDQFIRKNSLNDLGINLRGLSDDQCIQLICDNPSLFERPVIHDGNTAVIGRPPENILSFL